MPIDPAENISLRVPPIPYDDNEKGLSALVVAIVSGGDIVGYLPVKAIDNGDGTATLASTVNVTLDADVDIGNLHLLNIANAKIDPATEQKQDAIITAIGNISLAIVGVAEHHNGSATTTPAPVTFSGTSKSILIDNRAPAGDLLVSFDGGANTKAVSPGQSLSIDAAHASIQVSSSFGTVAFEILVTV